MKLGWRLLATMAVAFLLVPALRADDAEKAVTKQRIRMRLSIPPWHPTPQARLRRLLPRRRPRRTIKTRKAKRRYPQG